MDLHFERHGEKERSLVILHGFLGSGENWRTIARQLAEDFTVYLPDLRNHGKSGHSDEMSYDAMASDIARFIEKNVATESVDLIGHSMGGKIGFKISEQYPEVLNKLMVVDIAPKEYIGGHESILKTMDALDTSIVKNRNQASQELSEGIQDQVVRQFILKNLVRLEDGSYDWRIPLSSLIDNYPNINATIELSHGNKPDLALIYGSRSGYVDEFDLAQLSMLFPNFEHSALDAGHWVHAEKPGDFLHYAKKFYDILA